MFHYTIPPTELDREKPGSSPLCDQPWEEDWGYSGFACNKFGSMCAHCILWRLVGGQKGLYKHLLLLFIIIIIIIQVKVSLFCVLLYCIRLGSYSFCTVYLVDTVTISSLLICLNGCLLMRINNVKCIAILLVTIRYKQKWIDHNYINVIDCRRRFGDRMSKVTMNQ